ncbi:MAG: hypothetical protein KatS3mg107_0802 [Gemmataceae bacterium]|nr:MAG: hypothetical protein KatS3mg107_0802 [Gemmataceae bacterium]
MNPMQRRRLLWPSWSLAIILGLSLITSWGCGDSTKKPTAEMPKEKPNLGQAPAPPPLPPPPK